MKRIISIVVLIAFVLTSINTQGYAQLASANVLNLPKPGTMVGLSSSFEPTLIKGLTVHKDNPFLFDFIVDTGNSNLQGPELKKESDRLVKYFFACLTIPEKDLWVNLSPYEKDRMIPHALGQTALGRDLLAEDYILKQLTASMIYPEKSLGKEFWNRVYAKAQAMYGTTQIPVNTFNKVWILADHADVYENGQTAFVLDGHLKVMLDEDYLSLKKHQGQPGDMTSVVSSSTLPSETGLSAKASQGNNLTHSIASNIIRQIVLPEIEREVNTGKNFAALRQIYNSLILASWYRNNLKQALLNQVYADKSTVKGVNLADPSVKERIYQQYLRAYRKGVFNYIKEENSPSSISSITRKYFSGGFGVGQQYEKTWNSLSINGAGAAMTSSAWHNFGRAGKIFLAAAVITLNGVSTVLANTNSPTAQVSNTAPKLKLSLMTNTSTNGPSTSKPYREMDELTQSVIGLLWRASPNVVERRSLEIELQIPKIATDKWTAELPKTDNNASKAMLSPEAINGMGVGGYWLGMTLLAIGLKKGRELLNESRRTDDPTRKRILFESIKANLWHKIGPGIMLLSSFVLAHYAGDHRALVDITITNLTMMIVGGVAGHDKGWVKETLAEIKDVEGQVNPNLSRVEAKENFEGNKLRGFFYNSYWKVYGVFVAYGLLESAPAVFHVDQLHRFLSHANTLTDIFSAIGGAVIGGLLVYWERSIENNPQPPSKAMVSPWFIRGGFVMTSDLGAHLYTSNSQSLTPQPEDAKAIRTILKGKYTIDPRRLRLPALPLNKMDPLALGEVLTGEMLDRLSKPSHDAIVKDYQVNSRSVLQVLIDLLNSDNQEVKRMLYAERSLYWRAYLQEIFKRTGVTFGSLDRIEEEGGSSAHSEAMTVTELRQKMHSRVGRWVIYSSVVVGLGAMGAIWGLPELKRAYVTWIYEKAKNSTDAVELNQMLDKYRDNLPMRSRLWANAHLAAADKDKGVNGKAWRDIAGNPGLSKEQYAKLTKEAVDSLDAPVLMALDHNPSVSPDLKKQTTDALKVVQFIGRIGNPFGTQVQMGFDGPNETGAHYYHINNHPWFTFTNDKVAFESSNFIPPSVLGLNADDLLKRHPGATGAKVVIDDQSKEEHLEYRDTNGNWIRESPTNTLQKTNTPSTNAPAAGNNAMRSFDQAFKFFDNLFNKRELTPAQLQVYILLKALKEMETEKIETMSVPDFTQSFSKIIKELGFNISATVVTKEMQEKAEKKFRELYGHAPQESQIDLVHDLFGLHAGIAIPHTSRSWILIRRMYGDKMDEVLKILGLDLNAEVNVVLNVEAMKREKAYDNHLVIHEYAEAVAFYAQSIDEEFFKLIRTHNNKEVVEFQLIFTYLFGGKKKLQDTVKVVRTMHYKYKNRNLNERTRAMEQIFQRALDGSLLKEYGINAAQTTAPVNSARDGGIDLNTASMAMTVTKDAHGGVQVNFNPALIAQIRARGVWSAEPSVIQVTEMSKAQIQPLLGFNQ